MKKWRYSLLAVLMIFLAGCYEINEEVVIRADGTGTYGNRMDMGALLDMLMSVAGKEVLMEKGLDRAIDTTIVMKSVVDSVPEMSAEQKRLLANGTFKLQMNIEESLLKTDMDLPFQSYADLQSLMSGSGSGGLASVFKKVFADKEGEGPSSQVDHQGLEQINSVFDFTVKDGLLSRTLNEAKYQELMAKPEMAQVKQASGSGIEVPYTATIRLPRPVKQSDNPLIKLSPDKKTVTIHYDLMDLFSNPQKFSYKIEY